MSRAVYQPLDSKSRVPFDEPERISVKNDGLLLRLLRQERTASGLHIAYAGGGEPDASGQQVECRIGQVAALPGPGEWTTETGERIPWTLDCEPGDYLVIMGYAGRMFGQDGEQYRFVNEGSVWAKVTIRDAESLAVEAVEPVTDHVLVRRDEDEARRAGILILPHEKQVPTEIVTVERIGPGWRFWETGTKIPPPSGLVPGARAVMDRYAGANIRMADGSTLRLAQFRNFLAVVGEQTTRRTT